MRILERPTVVQCKVCGIDVKVGTRGPIPQQCPPHRGITTRKERKLTPRVSLPRKEVDRLRQGHADSIALQVRYKNDREEERQQHWRTKEILRDERLELAAARRRISDLETELHKLRAGPIPDDALPVPWDGSTFASDVSAEVDEIVLDAGGIYQLDPSVSAAAVETTTQPDGQRDAGFE